MSFKIWVDEAWRWPWAWPVCAGAVLFIKKSKIKWLLPLLNDSKKLSRKNREIAYSELLNAKQKWYIAFWFWSTEPEIIDEVWIKEANRLAMEKAINEILKEIRQSDIEKIQIDWRDNYKFKWIDSKIDEIKAASIIAKVTRDHLMENFDIKYPWYNFWKHCWYWTKSHQEAINTIWICPIHRKSFKPIKNLLIL